MSRLALSFCLAVLACASANADTPRIPSLQVTTLEGKPFDLARHRGKWVVINWWATWCGPCVKEMPEIAAFVTQNKANVVAIGLAFEDSEKAHIVEFLKKRPVPFPVAQVDPLEPLKDFGSPKGVPNTYVIAPDGSVAREFLGPVTARDLQAAIAAKP